MYPTKVVHPRFKSIQPLFRLFSSSTSGSFATTHGHKSEENNHVTVKFIGKEFKTHLCEPGPRKEVNTNKEELMKFHRDMFGIRRMELLADTEYKARNIRGFCHLYDGQEAVAVGINAALTLEDDWIDTYRIHGVSHIRGNSFESIFAELFGFQNGCSRGKGGSMHMYHKRNNLYGGAAIVGAHVPVGAGLGLYHNYIKKKGEKPKNVAIAMFGDGTANQGQVWEAANMAALWKIPIIFIIENNLFGMGTSIERSSANIHYYKQGNFIPGVKVDGMDVLAVKEAMRFCKEHALNGNGPMFMEALTYRYHGHSMSDPGITYRTRDEVNEMRTTRDPIEVVKKRITEFGFATIDELKEIEKEIRGEVQAALEKAKKGSLPDMKELFTDVYTTGKTLSKDDTRMESEYPLEIRMPDRAKSYHFDSN